MPGCKTGLASTSAWVNQAEKAKNKETRHVEPRSEPLHLLPRLHLLALHVRSGAHAELLWLLRLLRWTTRP